MKLIRRNIKLILMILSTFKALILVLIGKRVPLYWYDELPNFGDCLNVYLVEKIAQKKVVKIHPKYYPCKNYFVIGSVFSLINRHSIVWGTGIISENSKIIKPKLVLGVRGPLTRSKLNLSGIFCPEVYGDPALLLPLYYKPNQTKPNQTKHYKLGVIPHYVDKNNEWLDGFKNNIDVKVLDIQNCDIEDFVNQINKCDYILSSSLHGIIIADAYGIPSQWVQLSDNVTGGDFKFKDYFISVGRDIKEAKFISLTNNVESIIASFPEYKISIDLKRLLEACPFKSF